MKLSKSVLTAVAAGITIVAATTSCEKEEFREKSKEKEKCDLNEPHCGFGEDYPKTYEDCPGCGLG